MGQTCQKCSDQEAERKKEDIIHVPARNENTKHINGRSHSPDFVPESRSLDNIKTEKMKFSQRAIYNGSIKPDEMYRSKAQSTRHIGSDIKFSLTDHKDVAKLADGSTFEGNIVNGLPEGYGKQVTANGEEYIGYFIKGKKNGVGKLYRLDGSTYHGDFENNKMSGFGVIKYEDGSEYSGQFKNGLYHGKGREVDKNGRVTEGMWIEGKFQKSL